MNSKMDYLLREIAEEWLARLPKGKFIKKDTETIFALREALESVFHEKNTPLINEFIKNFVDGVYRPPMPGEPEKGFNNEIKADPEAQMNAVKPIINKDKTTKIGDIKNVYNINDINERNLWPENF